MRRARLLLAAGLILGICGCGPLDPQPAGGRRAEGPAVVEAPAPRAPAKAARSLTVLDPLDWSGKYLEANGLKLERRDGSVRLPVDEGEHAAELLAGAILALRRRMAVIAENVANAETARLSGAGGADAPAPAQPYRRKVLTVTAAGALEVAADSSAFRKVYRPNHPEADKDGRVLLPNVYVEVEQADWKASVREYEVLRLALGMISGRHVALPAELLPPPVPPPAYEEKPAPPPTPEPKPVAPPLPAPKAG